MGLAASLLLVVALAAGPWLLWLELAPRSPDLVARVRNRWFPPREPERVRRPIEEIAADVRVRGERFHSLAEHTSRVRRMALASAYDLVLAECCEALETPHLLGVLASGEELDRERRRVELVLHSFGMPVTPAA
jgi:hypothetical protein